MARLDQPANPPSGAVARKLQQTMTGRTNPLETLVDRKRDPIKAGGMTGDELKVSASRKVDNATLLELFPHGLRSALEAEG